MEFNLKDFDVEIKNGGIEVLKHSSSTVHHLISLTNNPQILRIVKQSGDHFLSVVPGKLNEDPASIRTFVFDEAIFGPKYPTSNGDIGSLKIGCHKVEDGPTHLNIWGIEGIGVSDILDIKPLRLRKSIQVVIALETLPDTGIVEIYCDSRHPRLVFVRVWEGAAYIRMV